MRSLMNYHESQSFYFGHALGVFSELCDDGNKGHAAKDALSIIQATKEFKIMDGRECVYCSVSGDFTGFLQVKAFAESEIGLPAGMQLVCVLKGGSRARFALTHVFPALVA